MILSSTSVIAEVYAGARRDATAHAPLRLPPSAIRPAPPAPRHPPRLEFALFPRHGRASLAEHSLRHIATWPTWSSAPAKPGIAEEVPAAMGLACCLRGARMVAGSRDGRSRQAALV